MTEEGGIPLRPVWCVAYDDFVPQMDGSHKRIRSGEYTDIRWAAAALEVIKKRTGAAPKNNLTIEVRYATPWEVVK